MSRWLAEYDKKSYKSSKKRRRQAINAGKTGRIKPIGILKRKISIIVLAIIIVTAVVIGAISLYIFVISPNSAERNNETLNSEQTDELLMVVNKQNQLDNDYIPQLVDYKNLKVNALLFDDLKRMCDDAKSDGIELKVVSGYVSFDEQAKLYNAKLREFLSNPDYTQVRAESAAQKIEPQAGCSEAQTGLLIGFDLSDEHSAAYLERNCVNYGFVLRFPYDKEDLTHISYNQSLYRYVGVDNAIKMRSYNMCLEEYAEYLADGNENY